MERQQRILNLLNSRIGERFTTTEGYTVTIVEAFYKNLYTIEFENGCRLKNRQYSEFSRGNIKNPYHPSVFGVGYFGQGKYTAKIKGKHTKAYTVWHGMIERGYCIKLKEKRPTYKNVTVCKEWHNFQNFAEWYEENWKSHMTGWHLDKDILVRGNKVYSPTTCRFVPPIINTLLISCLSKRGEYPIGVYKAAKKFICRVHINGKRIRFGVFNSPEEAFYVYKCIKEKEIKRMASIWKETLDLEIYESLYNWEILITD